MIANRDFSIKIRTSEMLVYSQCLGKYATNVSKQYF